MERIIEINKIEPTYFNPEIRTKDVDDLAKSIKENSLLYPVLVKKLPENKNGFEYSLIDGNRRFEAVKQLGGTLIKCIVLNENVDLEKIFAAVNNNSRPIKANEGFDIYMKTRKKFKKEYLPKSTLIAINFIEKNLGKKYLNYIYENKKSVINVSNGIKELVKITGNDTFSFKDLFFKYIIKYPMTRYYLQHAIHGGYLPDSRYVLEIIKQMKPFKLLIAK